MHTTKNPLHQEKLTMHDSGTQIPIPEELESSGTDPKELNPTDSDPKDSHVKCQRRGL
mgnify:CR=1 FL=1